MKNTEPKLEQTFVGRFKSVIRPFFSRILMAGKPSFTCPVCAHVGPFKDKKVRRLSDITRLHSKCMKCGATERHRMMFLVLQEVLKPIKKGENKILHIAPESSLKAILSSHYEIYHTSDLFKPYVDFNEDIQAMSFPDGSYDAVLESRVLTIPPDLEASLKELRRILKPGGIAILAETYTLPQTTEHAVKTDEHSRELGIDLLDRYRSHFSKVDLYLSDRYDEKYQLANITVKNGETFADYPEEVRIPGKGQMELVVVCTA